jgi:hypothetical protein
VSWILLIMQGAVFGVVSGWAFPGYSPEFFALVLANAVLTVSYGTMRKLED